uniref:C2H2-type domain-containing protein n=1 Tax=Mola mola TaxID=94237 RepID=A0A3Q3WAU5_MOLML
MVSERDQLLVAQHQLEVEPFDKGQSSVVHQQCQSEGETSVNEESDVTLQYADVQSTQEQLAQLTTSNKGKACNDLPNGAGKVEATPQPNLVRRRRGQPPKEVKHPQQVEELLKSQSLVIRTKQEVAEYPKDSVEEVEVSCAVDTINTTASKAPQACPLQSEEPSSIATPSSRESTKTALEYMEINKISPLALALAAQHVSINMGRSPIQASSTAVPPSESSQAPSIQQKECCTTVSLQDAMLLVDAMYQSKAENEVSSQHKMAEPIQTQIVPSMDALQTVDSMVNHASGEATKKILSVAVWTPPRMSVSDTPPTNEKRSAQVSVKQETSSPRSQNHPVVYPPSVSIHPIPVKAPAVVSPLQPLSVIGRRLLKNQCGECGCVLSSIAALESHVSLHTGQQPFSCTLCGKRFTDSKGLKRHGRVHRNGRIHVCQQCGKGFVYRFGLTKHLQMVHGRIKPFVCQICNKGCFTKLDVEAHIRIHTGEKPFHCNLCEKKFTRRVDLNVHLRWHNGEKRHWCPYCGKGFLDYNNLKRHKYIHTGEKPHSCPHCPKHFTQSGHLKKHIKNVHKIQ